VARQLSPSLNQIGADNRDKAALFPGPTRSFGTPMPRIPGRLRRCGTNGSNPSSSSGESANRRFLRGGAKSAGNGDAGARAAPETSQNPSEMGEKVVEEGAARPGT
jgi:hypothetical protein